MTDDGRLLLDVEEAAQLLGLTPRHISALARAHEIPHLRIGRYLRFRRESLEHWVREREQDEQ
jgi:excisionase family DNA binding protein